MECQVEMTEENTMIFKVALNKEDMEGVKVGHKVEFTVEYNKAVKIVHMEGNMVEEVGVAKARALGDHIVVEEKGTVVETMENKMNQLVDVVGKTKTKEGI